LDPEDGSDIFLRKVGPDYTVLYPEAFHNYRFENIEAKQGKTVI
jgi:hypothetical protein